jgi:hypothetical protein
MKAKQEKTAAPKAKPKGRKRPKSEAAKVDERAQMTVVASMRRNLELKLEKNAKASLSDYIRLVQLEKELQNTEAKETKATWVDPRATEEKPSEESDSEK